MFAILVLSHLLGDYALQFNCIARWKARSIWGVFAHGGIVTLATLACTVLVYPAWWPYAVWIGMLHTLIDIVRARLIQPKSTQQDLVWLLLDQAAHVGVIGAMVGLSNAPTLVALHNASGPALASWVNVKLVVASISYLLLLQPAWVLLRFIARGMYGPDVVPHLGVGEKYAPMLERVCIATLVCAGQFFLIPFVLLPRRLTTVRIQGNALGLVMHLTAHWVETALSVALAMSVGIALRFLFVSGW